MIELCFVISSKKSGEEVYRGEGKFQTLDSFFRYIATRYSYTSRSYNFMLSGREI